MSGLLQQSPITGKRANVRYRKGGADGLLISSALEGEYEISSECYDYLKVGFPQELKPRLLAAVRRASDAGRTPLLLTNNVAELAEAVPQTSPLDIPDEILRLAFRRSSSAGSLVHMSPEHDYPLTAVRSAEEMEWGVEAALELGYLSTARGAGWYRTIDNEQEVAVTLTPGRV